MNKSKPRGGRIPFGFQSLVPAGEAFPARVAPKNIRESDGERKRGEKGAL